MAATVPCKPHVPLILCFLGFWQKSNHKCDQIRDQIFKFLELGRQYLHISYRKDYSFSHGAIPVSLNHGSRV